MGSIEVYDSKGKKWVPYVPDFAKWERHFKDISEGRVRPDHKGRYIVGSGSRASTTDSTRPMVKLVTPVAQAIEMAKSELRRETRATSRLKSQNADSLFKEMYYRTRPNKKRLAQVMEEEEEEEDQRGSTRSPSIKENVKRQ
jgi:hypothetical protein